MAGKKSVCAFTDNSLRHYMLKGDALGMASGNGSSRAPDRYLPGYVRLSIRMRHAASSADQERLSVRIGLDRFERSGAYS